MIRKKLLGIARIRMHMHMHMQTSRITNNIVKAIEKINPDKHR